MSETEKYDYAWLSEQIGIPVTWLQKHKEELPRIEFGHYVRFSPALAEEIRAMFTVRPRDECLLEPAPVASTALLELRPGRAPRGRRKSA